MRHYFIAKEHKSSDYFTFDTNFNGKKFTFKSCSDVFSKNELDYGSLVLVRTIIKHKDEFSGNALDMCSGYGTIGILLSHFIDCNFDMCDINSTAVDLAIYNAKINNSKINVFESDMFARVEKKYNHIVSNPPIKTGKAKLFEFVDGALEHLELNGTLTLVIKKNLGEESLKKYIISKFGNCEILERDKGYYILHTIKTF